MDKSPDAFRTISEVAEDLDLPQHVLRFWETRFNQIKPLKRGGGRRYYRPSDVELLKGIRHLLYEEGYTIKGVQKILRENGNQFAIAIGSGDMSALEEMTKRTAQTADVEATDTKDAPAEQSTPVDDIVIGHSQPKSRGLFGLGRSNSTDQPVESGTAPISRDNRALLQEALFDLLECKRLLDQSR
ncbi:MAG: MerR family transcriptional regulator [Ahrensia sp.]